MKRPPGYRRPRRPKKAPPVVWTFRLPEPHATFLLECYPLGRGSSSLTDSIRLFLRRPQEPALRAKARTLDGYTSHHSARLSLEDWLRVEALAKKRGLTPAGAFVREVERRATELGYVLNVKRRNATW